MVGSDRERGNELKQGPECKVNLSHIVGLLFLGLKLISNLPFYIKLIFMTISKHQHAVT